jgi:PTS system cellobiose-specific IIA component
MDDRFSVFAFGMPKKIKQMNNFSVTLFSQANIGIPITWQTSNLAYQEDDAMEFDMEQTVMELLINAGEARSSAMMAIQAARGQDWAQADAQLLASKEAAKAAHLIQTRLIGLDEGEGKVPVNLIMVHAQDHLMTAMLCHDLAEELVLLRKELFERSSA